MTRGHQGVREVAYRTDKLEFFDGAGGLRSNVGDLLTYMQAQVGPPANEIERAMRVAREVRVPTESPTSGHGLAWHTADSPRGEPVVGHSGGTPGFSTGFFFMPESGIGVVLLANQRPFEDDLASTLLMPDPPPPDWVDVPVEREVLSLYAGAYARPGQPPGYFVRLEDEGLSYRPQGRPRAQLYATSDTTFYLLRSPWTFTFQPSDDPEAIEMIMEVDGRGAPATGRQVARRASQDTPSPATVAGRPDSPGRGLWMWVGLFAAVSLMIVGRSLRSGGRRART